MIQKNLLLISLALLIAPAAQAWSEHHLITQEAVQSLSGLQTEMVTPTPFEEMAQALGFKDQLDFNTKAQIKKEFIFDFQEHINRDPTKPFDSADPGQPLGVPVSAAAVLERYSDEPDWFMDREIFGADEYPELWQSNYAEMGGKTGLPSQAFRHMYWGPWQPWHPIVSIVIPSLGSPIGQAPDRAALYIDLARKTREAGAQQGNPNKYRYWTIRFVADALHYLEDVSQPFHASQVQTIQFEKIPLLKSYGHGLPKSKADVDIYIKEVTNVVAYYHLSFEDYVAYVMTQVPNSPEAENIQKALMTAPARPNQELVTAANQKDIAELVKMMAKYSQAKAPTAGKASLAYFPPIDPYFKAHPDQKLDQFDPEAYKDAAWWNSTAASLSKNSKQKIAYFGVVTDIFSQLGYAIRSVVQNELGGD